MGKGTRKKTVWRTFSFENGNCKENNASPANQNDDENTPASNIVSNWRYRRFHSNGMENMPSEHESHDDDLQKSEGLNDEQMSNTNGYHNNNYGYRHQYYHHHYNRPYYKRWPLSDQQYARNGFRKLSNENINSGTENGTKGENDNNNINNEDDSNRIQSNNYTRSYRTPFHRHFNGGYKRWENRYYNPNSSIGNYYNRGYRRSYFSHSDKQYPAYAKNNDHYYNKHCSTENGMNDHDCDKHNDESFGHQNGKQDSIKIIEDEYTRISTPRSEVLFKKGYLMRAKKYSESTSPTTAKSSIDPPTSSNDSGSVSVVSNEETASYYSIQSMSPENAAFVNGNICNDGTSISYPNENYNGDVPLIFSSGFYDNNGYFYVNPYVPNHYDQYNRPIGLIPYDNKTPTNGPSSTMTTDADHLNDFNKQHSINSEDISTSSLSENASMNNDSVTPQSPLTPPPSPLSPSDRISSNENVNECAENVNETATNVDEPALATDEKTLTETSDNEIEPKLIADIQNQSNETDAVDASEETIVRENYSMPYYPPFIFVPPIPFVSGGHMPYYQRRNRFHRRYSYHRHNHFRKYNRFFQYNDKFYVPTNWSEAPDETTVNVVRDTSATSDAEPASDEENSNDIIATSTLEQCDIILNNSKLNSNVSEFVPQNKRNEVMAPSPTYKQPIQLNVNVPEFLPKNHKPLAQCQSTDDVDNTILKCDQNNDDNTFDQAAAESKENDEMQSLDGITNSMKSDNDSQIEQVQRSITNCATSGSNVGVELNKNYNYNKNNTSTVRTLSDLLKTNSDTKTTITNKNSFVDRSELNKTISDARSSSSSSSSSKHQNSRMNLKAELGNKHRNKVWYNRNSSADYKNNYNTNNDLNINTNRNNNYDKSMSKNNNHNNNNTNNNNRMIKSAYPAINGHHRNHAKLTDVNQNNSNGGTFAGSPTKVLNRNDMKPLSNEAFSYAQMVVPPKSESIPSARNGTPPKSKPAKNITINLRSAKAEENPSIESKQSNNGSVEWFTVGAKGKKQALSNDKPNFVDFTMKLLKENTSKEEQVNSVAEELQLDIKNDSDLVLDIMDSLALSETKTITSQASNAGQKKKLSLAKASKKKSAKDKLIKESKQSRSQTFEIIEPIFENGSKRIAITGDVQETKPEENKAMDKNSQFNDVEEFTFDPNVFTAPLNLKADIAPENVPSAGSSCTALRLSANKSMRSLMNSFDIYQSDLNVSAEDQQLQKAEEMVNKVLESLKKTEASDDECASNGTNPTNLSDSMQQIQATNEITSDDDDDDDDDIHSSHSSASSISFEVNAKPYQNAYSSNHFLGHFFGDKHDKRDQVVHSANLSSSDQNIYTNTNAKQSNECDVSNIELTPNTTDADLVQNDDDSKSECDIINVVSPVESLSSEVEDFASNNKSDHKQAPEALDDRTPILGVHSKLNENKEYVETEFHDKSITQRKFSPESAHSIDDSPTNEEIVEPVVAIGDMKPVVERQRISSIDPKVHSEPKTESKSNHLNPNKQRPWLCIVDTQMLEKQKKMQNTFPITMAVSMWLNQAQKEKTPEPILRLPNDLHRNGFFGTKRTNKISQIGQSTSVATDQYYHVDNNYSSDETASLTSERDEKDKKDLASIVGDDDDEEDDIMNYWELDSQSMLAPKMPPAYQSVYGNSINYEKLLSNKNELLCNNIIDFDHVEETAASEPQTKATVSEQSSQTNSGPDGNYFKPAPEVCCTIM